MLVFLKMLIEETSRIESLLCAAVSEAVYEASLFLFPLCSLINLSNTDRGTESSAGIYL